MASKKTTRRALFSSLMTLLLCVSMLVGSTFAWFTDSVTSSGNIIASGNLDVAMYWADGTEAVPGDAGWTDASTGAIFNYDKWEPGFVQVRHIKIENKGTLALKYNVSIAANGTVSELADVIDVYYVDPAQQVTDRTALSNLPALGTLTSVLDKLGETGNGTLEAGDSDVITIAFKMQESAGNTYMNKAIGTDFSIKVAATQLNSESDSFNSSYDINAKYEEDSGSGSTPPTIYVSTAADLKAAMTPTISSDEATVILTSDIELADGETWTPLDLEAYSGNVRNIVIDGQGHTIKGLDAPLLGNCYFGNTSIEIKNLTLSESEIVNKHYNGLGSGAFVAYADNSKSVEFVNCHLVDSTITATGDFTGIGGIIGYSSSPLTITDCSVTNCTITGALNSAGAIAGHVSTGHNTTITNAKVIGCTVKGERVDKSGYVVGTANNGVTTITTDASCANNTVFDVADSTTVCGRLVGGSLTVNGVAQ